MAPMWFYSDTLTYTPGNDSFTKVLLHFDGANGGTTFTDTNAGGSAHTWSAGGGSPTTSTVSKEFGTASLLSGSTTGYINTVDSTNFTLGSGNFTIDFWFNKNGNNGTTMELCGQSTNATAANTAWICYFDTGNKINFFISNGAAYSSTISSATVTDSNWHHLAIVRNGNSIQIYLDGTATGSALSFAATVNDSAGGLKVSAYRDSSTTCFIGYTDEFRLSVGVARWTSNFTPPTLPYGPG